jgi:hypothetical protein
MRSVIIVIATSNDHEVDNMANEVSTKELQVRNRSRTLIPFFPLKFISSIAGFWVQVIASTIEY